VPRRQPVYLDEGDSCTRLNANLQPGSMPPEATARQRRVGSRTPEEWSAVAVIASVIVAVISAIAAVIALFITRGQMEETWRTRYVDALKPGRLPLPLEVRHSTKQTLEGWMQEDSRTFPGPAFMTMSTGPGLQPSDISGLSAASTLASR
jgi:hypothetical protein